MCMKPCFNRTVCGFIYCGVSMYHQFTADYLFALVNCVWCSLWGATLSDAAP